MTEQNTQKDVDIWYEFLNDDGDLMMYYYCYIQLINDYEDEL